MLRKLSQTIEIVRLGAFGQVTAFAVTGEDSVSGVRAGEGFIGMTLGVCAPERGTSVLCVIGLRNVSY